MRDLTQLKGMDLGIDDARVIVEELASNWRVEEFWTVRQLAWKAKLCDVRRIEVNISFRDDIRELLQDLTNNWTVGWPLIQVDEEEGLVKIGWTELDSSIWIWVEHFQVDDSALVPVDDPCIAEEYGDLLVA